jgi:hypothetical protein
MITCGVLQLLMLQFSRVPIMLLYLIESCSVASAEGMDKSKSERRAAAVGGLGPGSLTGINH